MAEITDQDQELIDLALEATQKAYAPYSNFHVGAAYRTTDGKVYTGCNVENISYGLTICAERSAIVSGVSAQGPKLEIETLANVALKNGEQVVCTPCGACRQFIAELGKDATIIFLKEEGYVKRKMGELLTDSFDF